MHNIIILYLTDSSYVNWILKSKFYPFADSSYAYRIRFMIQDVVELRDNNWVPRRIEAKPQRIDDIHREHAKEEQQKKMEAAVAQSSRKSKSSKCLEWKEGGGGGLPKQQF